MVPDDYELEIIRKIQTFRQEGLSLRKIAKRLTDLEYQPRKVNRPFKGRTVQVKGKWHHGLIRSILKRVDTEKKNGME
jgi:DNA-binding transcriptional MerR regulator